MTDGESVTGGVSATWLTLRLGEEVEGTFLKGVVTVDCDGTDGAFQECSVLMDDVVFGPLGLFKDRTLGSGVLPLGVLGIRVLRR